ncbi:MAG TPA: DUF4190 domain-containing protein [Labilithrix sp.]|nr:DUF4190 domain-containing protein [Labilithrix sp.]
MGPPFPIQPPARTEGKAALALLLGVVSMGCFGPITGLPAMIVGAIARREIDREGGALTGRGLAAAGIVSGFFGTGLGLVLGLSILSAAVSPETEPAQQEVAAASTASLTNTDDNAPVAANSALSATSDVPTKTCSSGSLEMMHSTSNVEARCASFARTASAPAAAEARRRCP